MKTIVKERPYIIPSMYRIIRDEGENKAVVLERHFNDLYKFYLRKLGVFEAESYFDETAVQELSGVFQELIKLKKLIEDGE